MKRIGLILMLTFVMLANFTAVAESDGRYGVVKTFEQSYDVSNGDKLSLVAVFGNVNIVEWDKNVVSFNIEFRVKAKRANASTTKMMQRYIDAFDVKFSQIGKTVSCMATMESTNDKFNISDIEIEYQVYVPRDIYMILESKYGNINVEAVQNPIVVNMKYGNFSVAKLNGDNNKLSVKYGNIAIEEAKSINIELKYGNSNIGTIDNLTINSGYSNNVIKKANVINLTSKYGNAKIEEVNNLNGSLAYDGLTINNLYNSLNLSDLAYSSLRIGEVGLDFTNIDVNAKYSPIRIKLTDQHKYYTTLKVKYGAIKMDGQPNISGESASYISGDETSTSSIRITNAYSDINITK